MGMRGLAVVTGGGKGIGAAASQRLAADGYRVLLTYHSSSQAAEVVVEKIRSAGGDAFAVRVDCSDVSEVYLLSDHPWIKDDTAGSVEVLVLNHGRYDRMATDELTPEHLKRTMDTNFTGAYHVWNALSSHLSSTARIVVVGSQLGVRGSPHGGDYSASKAALHAWARSLAQAVGPKGQRVNILAPGFVDTAILAGDSVERRAAREAEVPLQRVGTPEDMAGVISFLVSEDSSYVNGAIIHANGGLFLP
ncbi:MAG: SDR family NAD(P)-dependent oxidoreductase [Candidatus Poseidoniaceae archaeon]|jgi:3-oxoacyl-[acyl-carrier protein] reductase|nr:SDR family NAD(P)-dependent oxidoreductase [Candidatus Poseidoniaceae archaeon]